MKTITLLVLELIGGLILLAVCIARILVAYRKHFLPYHSERFGVVTFILACMCGWSVAIFYGITGVRIMKWNNQGLSDEAIRYKLLTPGEFKGVYATTLLAANCIYFGKASFLAMYSASYRQFSRRIQWLYIFSITYTVATYLIIMGLFGLYCWPVSRNWTIVSTDPKMKFCNTVLQAVPLNTALALSISSDLLLFSLPLILIISLGMRSKGEKYGVALIMLLGIVSIGCGLYRLIDTHINGFTRGTPLTISSRNSYIISEMVMNTLLLTAFALPSLRLLFRSTGARRRKDTCRRKESEQRSAARSFSDTRESKRLYAIELQPK